MQNKLKHRSTYEDIQLIATADAISKRPDDFHTTVHSLWPAASFMISVTDIVILRVKETAINLHKCQWSLAHNTSFRYIDLVTTELYYGDKRTEWGQVSVNRLCFSRMIVAMADDSIEERKLQISIPYHFTKLLSFIIGVCGGSCSFEWSTLHNFKAVKNLIKLPLSLLLSSALRLSS